MAIGFIDTSVLTDIANAIRQQNGTDETYLPSGTGLLQADVSGMALDVMERSGLSCMFYGCTALATIYAQTGWSVPAGLYASNMFTNCRSIVGGAGTVYDGGKTSIAYFRIDGGPDAPGYLTVRA